MTRLREVASPGAVLRWAHFRISDVTANYLDKCARIRNISRTCLINRLLDVVAEDQLIGSIFDDADTILQRRPGERYFKDHGNPP